MAGGTWREAGTGAARGPKYDNAILAHVLHEQLGRRQGAQATRPHYQGRIEADKGYRAKVLANPGDQDRLLRRAGEARQHHRSTLAWTALPKRPPRSDTRGPSGPLAIRQALPS